MTEFKSVIVLFFVSANLWANEVMRPMRPSELPLGTQADTAVRVKTAKVVKFNRAAIERDFPYLAGRSNAEIENWILENFAYVNFRQLQLNNIRNTPIEAEMSDRKKFWVPPGVGRGAHIQVAGGMVDLKASGNTWWNAEQVAELVQKGTSSEQALLEVQGKDHSSGLETYNLATAEYLRQLEIQEEFNRQNQNGGNMETVESYFLIDYGFDILFPGQKIRAFAYGRQAQFGRTAENQRSRNEFYSDKGKYQESYLRTRIDFGGARTPGETEMAYHDSAANQPPEQMGSYVDQELKRIQREKAAVAPSPAQFQPTEKLVETIDRLWRELKELSPHPAAIGLSALDMMEQWRESKWIVDQPQTAELKWRTMQMTEPDLIRFLSSLSEQALSNLFAISRHKFRMPLPEKAYAFGMSSSDDVANSAVGAAAHVFDRFPNLVSPALTLAKKLLKAKEDSWAPSCIEELIDVDVEFRGYDEFLLELLKTKNAHVKVSVIERIYKYPGKNGRQARLVEYIQKHERDRRVLDQFKVRFPKEFESCEQSVM